MEVHGLCIFPALLLVLHNKYARDVAAADGVHAQLDMRVEEL